MKESFLRRCLRFFERNWCQLGVAFVVLVVLALGLLVWPVPGLWNHLQKPDKAYYALRPSLVTASAALFAAVFLFWRNITADRQLKNSQEQLENSQEQLKNAQKQLKNAQLSREEERYKEGVELLGHEKRVVRIGGLYVLHQLAEDFSEKWTLPVLDLMCAFVRKPPLYENQAEGTGKKELRRDVQEAVQLLGLRGFGRRKKEKLEQEKVEKEGRGKSPGGGKLDFHGADLEGGSWASADLGKANFRGATLTDANFFEATLTDADFKGARLEKANFEGGTLTGAVFFKATFTKADFKGAILEKASFFEATLTEAVFSDATLTDADFSGATLAGADITEASLKDANLSGVILLVQNSFVEDHPRFTPVKGATREQLEEGWAERDQPPVKIVEHRDASGSSQKTTMDLTEADWKEIGLDAPPTLREGPPPGWGELQRVG